MITKIETDDTMYNIYPRKYISSDYVVPPSLLFLVLLYRFPSPLTCHAIIRFTAGTTPSNRRVQYGTSTTRVVPKVVITPMILFVKRITDSALALRLCPYTWSGSEPDVSGGVVF
jgi:hypothetical protein